MEFMRGFIIPAIDFYFTLKMPNIINISDALSLWSQKFQSRELKAVLSMFAGLLYSRHYDYNELKDKEKASQQVADYIRRIMAIVTHKFTDVGLETSLCAKSNSRINFNSADLDRTFRDFLNAYRSKSHDDCNLHLFLERNNSKINEISDRQDEKVKDSNSAGFKEIVKALRSESDISCKHCSKIGDAIIALISPERMRLEHTDYSFDYLMMILGKNHKRHPSEIVLNRE